MNDRIDAVLEHFDGFPCPGCKDASALLIMMRGGEHLVAPTAEMPAETESRPSVPHWHGKESHTHPVAMTEYEGVVEDHDHDLLGYVVQPTSQQGVSLENVRAPICGRCGEAIEGDYIRGTESLPPMHTYDCMEPEEPVPAEKLFV